MGPVVEGEPNISLSQNTFFPLPPLVPRRLTVHPRTSYDDDDTYLRWSYAASAVGRSTTFQ